MPELALLRFVVLDDDYIGDDFIGQYSVAFECLQPGYRNVPLLGIAGDQLPHTSLFVHVAVTNRRGGGKAQRRGLSVRRVGRRGREYVTLRHTGIKVVDEAFKLASTPLKEATDLREDAQVRGDMGWNCLAIGKTHLLTGGPRKGDLKLVFLRYSRGVFFVLFFFTEIKYSDK